MNFHDKRVRIALLILAALLVIIGFRIVSNMMARNAETKRAGTGGRGSHIPDLNMDNRLPLQTHRQLRYNELRLP